MIDKDEQKKTAFRAPWDQLSERQPAEDEPKKAASEHHDHAPDKGPGTALFAAAWADLVCMTAVCTTALLALLGLGYQTTLSTFPWAVGVGALWWTVAAAATLVVRRATPGMLMAGIRFDGAMDSSRIPVVVLIALLQALTLGVLCLLGARWSLLRRAAGGPAIVVAEQPSL